MEIVRFNARGKEYFNTQVCLRLKKKEKFMKRTRKKKLKLMQGNISEQDSFEAAYAY